MLSCYKAVSPMWMKGTKFRSFVGIPSVPNHQVISLAQIFIKDKLLLVS